MHHQLSDYFNDILIHSWQHLAKGLGASLLCCACSKIGERPLTTINLQLQCSWTCLRTLTAFPMVSELKN